MLDAKKPSAKMASMLCDSECPLPKHATGPSSGDRNTASLASNVAAPGDGAGGGGRTTPPHSELPVTLATPGGPVTTSALATPVRLVTMPMASTPFLSTRKHKAVAGKGGVGVRGTPAPPSQGRDEEERVKTQTQDSRTGPSSMVVGTHPSLGGVGRTIVGMSPFRLFSGMGGKRSKVADTEVVWKEGEEEEEEPWEVVDPLSNGVKYDPVVTNDGFIYPRKQPRKIIPRGAFLSMSCDPASAPSVPECVEVVRLVVVVEKHEGLGRMAVVDGDGGKLRNFKRFRKVGSSGLTQMPRIVGLVEHTETSVEAQQWLMEQEEEREPSEDEAEINDIFRFT